MRDLVLFHSALADQNRLRLICLISEGEICVCHLQNILRTNQPRISRHLAYLRRAGLAQGRREGKWTHYSLKKLDPQLQQILAKTLVYLREQPQIKTDRERLKRIAGCSTRR